MEAIDFLPVLYAFVACLGFGGLYNLHGSPILWAAVGGALGWLVYLLTLLFAPDFFAGFLSAAAVSFYAEVLARLQKRTVTTYLLIGIIPGGHRPVYFRGPAHAGYGRSTGHRHSGGGFHLAHDPPGAAPPQLIPYSAVFSSAGAQQCAR